LGNFWDLGINPTRLLGYIEVNKPYSTILGMEQRARAEDRKQRTEVREQRGKGQKTENSK